MPVCTLWQSGLNWGIVEPFHICEVSRKKVKVEDTEMQTEMQKLMGPRSNHPVSQSEMTRLECCENFVSCYLEDSLIYSERSGLEELTTPSCPFSPELAQHLLRPELGFVDPNQPSRNESSNCPLFLLTAPLTQLKTNIGGHFVLCPCCVHWSDCFFLQPPIKTLLLQIISDTTN